MDKYQCVAVRMEDREKQKNIELYASETEIGFRIGTTIDGMEIYADGEGYFETFQRCRDKILDLGYGLKCNGSRINAVQSNLMSACEKIYLVEIGKQAQLKDIVFIWDYAEIQEFPNTKEQQEFTEQWLKHT